MPIFCLNLVCPLVWINYSRTPNNRIAGLYKTALSSLCNDFLSPFSKLLEKDKSVTIHHRNLRTLALKIFKMKNSMVAKKFPSRKAIVILEIAQHCNIDVIEPSCMIWKLYLVLDKKDGILPTELKNCVSYIIQKVIQKNSWVNPPKIVHDKNRFILDSASI